jgi:hypothetical protein
LSSLKTIQDLKLARRSNAIKKIKIFKKDLMKASDAYFSSDRKDAEFAALKQAFFAKREELWDFLSEEVQTIEYAKELLDVKKECMTNFLSKRYAYATLEGSTHEARSRNQVKTQDIRVWKEDHTKLNFIQYNASILAKITRCSGPHRGLLNTILKKSNGFTRGLLADAEQLTDAYLQDTKKIETAAQLDNTLIPLIHEVNSFVEEQLRCPSPEARRDEMLGKMLALHICATTGISLNADFMIFDIEVVFPMVLPIQRYNMHTALSRV